MGRLFLSFPLILIPFLIVNGILTGSFIEDEVVWYNSSGNLGIRILTIPVEDVAEMYGKCQYISLHMPANAQTKKSVNYDLISKMPKGATIVNTARKEVVDEESLLRVFSERPDFKYMSDVEPDCKSEIAEKYAGRYYFTPKKMGAQTSEANNNAGLAAARQIIAFFDSGDTTFQVNK